MPPLPDTAMPDTAPRQRLALLLEYDGSQFRGSQAQRGDAPTVQNALGDAFRQLQLAERNPILAGRTDAGVHAYGQVGHLDVDAERLKRFEDNLLIALNTNLPGGLALRGVAKAAPDFHAQLKAKARWYRYRLFISPQRRVWQPQASTWLRQANGLDTKAMTKAMAFLEGRHDFSAFRSPGRHTNRAIPSPICHMYQARLSEEGSQSLVFDLIADRYVYHMVRNIVGLLILVGQDQLPPEIVAERLAPGASRAEGLTLANGNRVGMPTAKPDGLTLQALSYAPCFRYFGTCAFTDELSCLLEADPSANKTSQAFQPALF